MKIQEVSIQYGVSRDTLRYYEKIGLIGPVKKNSSGIRDYEEKDIRRIRFIKYMRASGVSIETIHRYIELSNQGIDTVEERKEILNYEQKKLKREYEEAKAKLECVEYMIDHFNETLFDRELKRYEKEHHND